MHLEGLLNEIEGTVRSQIAIGANNRAVESAAGIVMAALRPALNQAAFSLAEQAALEVSAQLSGQTVEVVVADGEPVLRVTESAGDDSTSSPEEDLSARITLRLPPSVKNLVEEAAGGSGSSVNQWVVEALSRGAKGKSRGKSETRTFDL